MPLTAALVVSPAPPHPPARARSRRAVRVRSAPSLARASGPLAGLLLAAVVACGRGADRPQSGQRTVDLDLTSERNRAESDSIRRHWDSVNAHRRFLQEHDPVAAARERDSAYDAMLPGTSAPHGPQTGRGRAGRPR